MIPNITRGQDTAGLLRYLIGRGRRDEHHDQRLVGGSREAVAMIGGRLLKREDAAPLGRLLDEPMNLLGERVTVSNRGKDGTVSGRRDAHVWHCSLSLHPTEPELDNATWNEIAEAFMSDMGFAGPGARRGECRWLAVRHGRSAGGSDHVGSDHVHLVVTLVSESGQVADVHNDRPRAQDACRALEQRFGLRAVEARGRGGGERGIRKGELAADHRRGLNVGEHGERPELGSRQVLERIVRACGAAAVDERDFVKRLRSEGLLTHPRFAKGGTDEVVGYSVAIGPDVEGERLIWFGGGRLSRELTLPRLRENWPKLDQEIVAAAWRAKGTNTTGPRRARTQRPASPDLQARCVRELTALSKQLGEVPATDAATWAHAAREAAGMFAAWSLRTEVTPGPLAETSRMLARSGQLRRHAARGRRWRSLPSRHTSALLLAASPDARAALQIFQQLRGLSNAIADMHHAVGDLQRAQELRDLSRGQLAAVTSELQARDVRAHVAGSEPRIQRPGPAGPERGRE